MKRPFSFIAGCFDGGLHKGHFHILREASKLGTLIVAINDDEHLAKKGPGRPIRNLGERIQDLLQTGLVAQVMSFKGSDPLPIITLLRPDFIVVGDDYEVEQVVGAKECAVWGGQVVIVPRIAGISTTKIIKERQSQIITSQDMIDCANKPIKCDLLIPPSWRENSLTATD